ncbi:hypothetical protein [Halobacteriovorax sp. JY17]|uniref:hypothetical protein n=1 Tax=Halobacteriovorax sp. JY17 TaxID=2014617 RepID=UPI000C61CDA4|nr:hypothetical protein [Halobacteriovorax sp. JY17]PIK14302.1 MAG: hypothetical protein CES88_15110 [Halobacteriovorax sp. JY17]
MQIEGLWLSISEYSQLRNISVSTVRRYIKSERVRFKKENGKFLIFMSEENYNKYENRNGTEGELLKSKLEIQELQLQLKSLQLENDELKMLVDLYEGQSNTNQLPEIPVGL